MPCKETVLALAQSILESAFDGNIILSATLHVLRYVLMFLLGSIILFCINLHAENSNAMID